MTIGIAIPNVNASKLSKLPIPLPPLAEQKRISSELDAIFSHVHAAQAELAKMPALIKMFRQKVLAMAVSGELTRDFRANTAIGEIKTYYLDEIANIIDPHPSHRTPAIMEGGIPYIGMGDINKNGTLDLEEARKVSFDVLEEHRKRYQLKEGDFIFGKIGTIGKPTKLVLPQNYAISANVILVQPHPSKVHPSFLYFYLSSMIFEEEVRKELRAALQPLLGIKKMKSFIVKIPPLAEQTEIVKRVSELFTWCDAMESAYKDGVANLKLLPQSLLQRAFSGTMLPQNAGDEPASKLLERIQAAQMLPKSAKKQIKIHF
jgi:type I restriction enzyme, S subunit